MIQDADRSERILVKYPLFKTAIARIQSCFDSHETAAEPYCCPIVGESGSGRRPSFLTLRASIPASTTSGESRFQCSSQRFPRGLR